MPVVRELINRISFKVNPADKKNAENTIANMDKGIKGLLSTAKLLGAALAGTIFAGGAQLSKFEKSTSQIKFFSKTKEEAEAIIKIFDKMAEDSKIISEVQGREAGGIISKLNIDLASIQKIGPMLAAIDLSKLDLDFKETTEVFAAAIKGDLESFNQLLPGFKNVAEQLSKSNFGKSFADLTQQNKFNLFLQEYAKRIGTINRLGKENRDSLTNDINELTESTSDITKQFGVAFETPMRAALVLANELIERLQNNTGFWELIKSVADSLTGAIQFIRAGEIPEETKNIFGLDRFEEGAFLSKDLPSFSGFFDFINSLKTAGSELLSNVKSKGFEGVSSALVSDIPTEFRRPQDELSTELPQKSDFRRAVSAEFFENVKKGGIGGEKQGIFTGELTEDQTKLVEKLDERNKKRLKAASDFIKNTFFTFSPEGPKFRVPQLEDVKALEGTGEDFEGTISAPTKNDFERTIDAIKGKGKELLNPILPEFLKISGTIFLENKNGEPVGALASSELTQFISIFKEGLNNVSAQGGSVNVGIGDRIG